MSKAPEQKETPQQRALAELAMKQLQDYKQRWLPVQQKLAENVQLMAKPGSAERKIAAGKVATDTAVRFTEGKGAVENALTQRGAGAGSSKFKIASAGMGDDEATARGLGFVAADQQIDDAYMQALGQLTALGRGERAGAVQGMGDVAALSGRQAAADAEMSAARRAGNAQLVGQFAGMGMSGAFNGAGDRLQAKFSQTGLGGSGFGTGLAYGNQDMGAFL